MRLRLRGRRWHIQPSPTMNNTVFCLPLKSNSWCRGYSHVEQAVGENVPEYSTEHKQGVDTEKYPKQGLLLEFLFIVLQDHHTQGQADCHASQVRHKAGVGAWREGWRVEPQPHGTTKLYTH